MKYQQGKELRKFNYMYRKAEEIYHDLSLKMGLSDSVFFILYTICENGDGCSQKFLCQQISISKQTINSAIRRLEKNGDIRLQRGEKGRELLVYLTEQGKKLVQEKIYPIMEMEERVFVKMLKKEREEFLRLLEKYMVYLEGEAALLLEEEVKR